MNRSLNTWTFPSPKSSWTHIRRSITSFLALFGQFMLRTLLNALVAAIGKAGSTDPDKVASTLRTMTDAKGITGPLLFTDRGDRKDIPYYAYIYNDAAN